MNVEFTGRKCEITPTLRKSVETGLTKIRKILGDKFDSKVILAIEKHRHKAEITISPRNGPLVGIAQAGDMKSAINQAIDHLEKQAVKYKTRWRSKKRHEQKNHNKKWNGKGRPGQSAGCRRTRRDCRDFTRRTQVSGRCQIHRGSPGTHRRCRSCPSHDSRRGDQGSPLPRSRRFCLPRPSRQSDGPAPHPRRQNGTNRSAVKRASPQTV